MPHSRNRYIVECKEGNSTSSHNAFSVEIDTLWNVKKVRLRYSCLAEDVEIDTLWNVKANKLAVH